MIKYPMKFLARPAVHIALIALLGLIAYSNTFDVPFILDEKFYIAENPVIRDISFFSSPYRAKRFEFLYEAMRDRYVGYITFALNYRFGGLNVRGYHLVNITIHLANACLVYLFITLIPRTPFMSASRLKPHWGRIAFLSALLFALHPIQTGAITYIYQRFALLVTLFYLGSLLFYMKWRLASPPQTPDGKPVGGIFYFLSLFLALLAVKTKENAFTLPFAISLIEFMFFNGSLKKRAIYIFPFLLTAAIIPLSIMDSGMPVAEAMGGATKTTVFISRHDYLITQLPVIATYIRLLSLPIRQNFDYDYPVYTSFFEPNVLLSVALLTAILSISSVFYFRFRKNEPAFLIVPFGVLWFFATIFVESSAIALADVIFEHRVYLPSIGAFLAFSAVVFLPLARTGNRKTGFAIFGAAAVLVIMLSALSYKRNAVWGDGVSLWEDVLRKSPKKARAYFGLGYAYEQKGMLDKAMEHFKAALGPKSDRSTVQTEIALKYWEKGQKDRAIEHFKGALLLSPDSAIAHYNLAVAYASIGERKLAEELLKQSLSLDPALSSRIVQVPSEKK